MFDRNAVGDEKAPSVLLVPISDFNAFGALARDWIVPQRRHISGGQHDLIAMETVFPSRHGSVARAIIENVGNAFDRADVFPMIVGQVRSDQTTTVSAVASRAVGLVSRFADGEPFRFFV